MSPDDAILLFPEGGNWTPRRHHRAISRLRRAGRREDAADAAGNPHVLPPRPAGMLACLAARPDLDVAVVAHTGLEDLVSPGLIWRALPVSARPMVIRWWHEPAGPAAGRPMRTGGNGSALQWAIVDAWIDRDGRRRTAVPRIASRCCPAAVQHRPDSRARRLTRRDAVSLPATFASRRHGQFGAAVQAAEAAAGGPRWLLTQLAEGDWPTVGGRRAANSKCMAGLARAGFVARGIQYSLIGIIALQIALGTSHQQADRSGRGPAGGATPSASDLVAAGHRVCWHGAVAAVGGDLGAPGPDGRKAAKRLASLANVLYTAFLPTAC